MEDTLIKTVGLHRKHSAKHGATNEATKGCMEIYLALPNGKMPLLPNKTHRFESRRERRTVAREWYSLYAKPYVLIVKPDF